MNSKNTVYSSILKATGVFGAMQVIRMIIGIVTSKFLAIFLGPFGIGILSLLNNAINIIVAISNFEFLKTATREIALANNSEDKSILSKTINTIQCMAIIIGVFGAIISALFSKMLSQFTFGNQDKQHWFLVLSIYFLVISLANARMAILQGVNKIKTLAYSNVVAAFITAIGTIVIYYFYRIEGIVWAFLFSSVVLLFVTLYFTRNYKIDFSSFNFKELLRESSPIFVLGFFMSLNLIFGQICNFLIKLYINDGGNSSNILGFFEVSSVILINYLGLIFNAMSFDFFPKLSAVSKDNLEIKKLVNNQIEIAIILVTPAVIFLYLFGPFIIQILYSKAFLSSFIILKVALFSVILKSIIFPLGYIVLAKGDKKLFFQQALFSDILNLVFSLVLYHYFGLIGLGFAYVFNYAIYGIYIYYITNKHYDFTFFIDCKKLVLINIAFGIIAIISVLFFELFYSNLILVCLLLISIIYSIKELDERINIKEALVKILNKFKRK
jgi:O-antigen/teichoic acid export membrane protein